MKFRRLYRFVFLIFFSALTCMSFAGKRSMESIIKESVDAIHISFGKKQYKTSLEPLYTVLTLDTIIPDETAFLLGVALQKVDQPEASQKAFLKYIWLTGDSSEYFVEAVQGLHAVNLVLGKGDQTNDQICDRLPVLEGSVTCDNCHGQKVFEQECTSCRGTLNEVCPVCRGKGVIVQFSYYDEYSACYNCEGKGYVPCGRCDGSGTEQRECLVCKASGEISTPRDCDFVTKLADKELVEKANLRAKVYHAEEEEPIEDLEKVNQVDEDEHVDPDLDLMDDGYPPNDSN